MSEQLILNGEIRNRPSRPLGKTLDELTVEPLLTQFSTNVEEVMLGHLGHFLEDGHDVTRVVHQMGRTPRCQSGTVVPDFHTGTRVNAWTLSHTISTTRFVCSCESRTSLKGRYCLQQVDEFAHRNVRLTKNCCKRPPCKLPVNRDNHRSAPLTAEFHMTTSLPGLCKANLLKRSDDLLTRNNR